MTYQYIPFMAKIIRAQRAKKRLRSIAAEESGKSRKAQGQSSARPRPAKPAKAIAEVQSSKTMDAAEVREAFERFRKANPEPRGELEHLNPFTLLVAVVLSAQATDAGVNRATRALFKVADTPQKMLELGEEACATTSRPSGSIATRRRT